MVGPDQFTIRMHHGGQFFNLGKRVYGGPCLQIDHFDYCDVDELSMLEINAMAGELGLKRVKGFYCSRGGIDDADTVYPLVTDSDVLLVGQFINDQRVVGLFVEHEEEYVEERETTEREDSEHPSAEVTEPVNNMGEGNEDEEGNGEVREESEDVELPQFPDPLYHVIDDVDSGGSDDANSVGSDSDLSEDFVDSEADISDDELFRNNVDSDVEWGAQQQEVPVDEGCSSVVTRSKRNSTVFKEKEKMKGPSFPVFNKKLDLADPKFEVLMTFPDHKEFKAAVRAHSIKWGREIKFIMNQPEKVQAKCQGEKCNWQIYAAQIQGESTMQVRTFCGRHKCPRLQKISHANAKWVADNYYRKLCLDAKWDVDIMGRILQNELSSEFTRHQLYRARNIAASMGVGIILNSMPSYGIMQKS